jgi:hypothetical protein
MTGLGPWALPGLGRWLDDVARRLDGGLAVVPGDATRPPKTMDALRERLRHHAVDVRPEAGQSPAAVLANAFGTAPTLEALLNPVLDHELAIIDLGGLGSNDLATWSVFLSRFANERASGRAGLALLVTDPPASLNVSSSALAGSWLTHLRRGDLVIWAEENLPGVREGLAAELAVALAVELCGWRLDLGSMLVRARLEDLADPISWLSRRPEAPISGADPPCPLHCLADVQENELRQRIWKAQLTALFPALEDRRQELVARHRDRLRVDEHLCRLGVTSVDEIELGAIRFQLRRYLPRPEAERLDVLCKARNKLAHRQAIDPADVIALLRP